VLPIVKKILPAIAFLSIVTGASAQRNTHFVSGHISEKGLVELQLKRVVNKSSRPIAEYKISPNNSDFAFAIPADTGVTYQLQVNIMKQEGRHAKVHKGFTLPLPLNSEQNYTLKVTPSKLNEAKKTGWELKQEKASSSVAIINGKVLGPIVRSGMQVSLQQVEDGAMVVRNTVQTDSEGAFEMACLVKKEGFYYLTTPRCRVRVYLKPADRIRVDIDNKTGNPVLLSGSRENEILHQWQQLILPITSYGYNLNLFSTDSIDLNEYIRTYEKLKPAIAAFPSNINNTSAPFVKAFTNARDIDGQLAPIYFLLYKSAKKVKGWQPLPKDFNEVPASYKQFIQPGKFSNASVLRIGEALQFMNLYTKLNMALVPEQERKAWTQSDKLKWMMSQISNDTLKSVFLKSQLEQLEVNNLSEFIETFEPYKKYAKSGDVKAKYQSIYNLYIGDTAYIGKSSYNFTLPDTTGRMVSMKDFKGKVVLIDVWATWCGPCKAQFPFYKEIEEEYKDNKDIVFVGISIDRATDREKWLKMIQKEKLGGLQLLDDTGKAFADLYEINAIPRFLLIDKQGKWIEIRCPRPELKEELKRYLDKALKG
jgi:thiol-disulfide isomerase/thioredoxin